MGVLQNIGKSCRTDKATYHKFCDFYEKHLPERNSVLQLLEIGVKDGASLKMWRQYYYNPHTGIYGIDINKPLRFRDSAIHYLQGDATKLETLRELKELYPHFDIVIDDGSHMTADQQYSFFYFHQFMRSGDIYIIEDIHTSAWGEYKNSPLTTEEFVRDLIPGWQIFIHQTEENPNDSKTMLIIKP